MGSNAEVLWLVLVGSNGSLSIEKGEMSEYMDGHSSWVNVMVGEWGVSLLSVTFKKLK